MRADPRTALRRLYRQLTPMDLTATRIREYDRHATTSDETETATFGLGCFWGLDAQFGVLDGVVRTRVAYAGGTARDPTYHSLGNPTEAFQVEFDPDTVTYRELLDLVFESHDPRHQTRKTQYQNVVLIATAAQHATLTEFLSSRGLTVDGIGTRIEQLSRFYPAEGYQQKHKLRSVSSLVNAFDDAGYDPEAVRESPIAAKLNGYAAGHDVAAFEAPSTSG